MASGPTFRVAYRRRRSQKTNYHTRFNMLKSGTARLVVRPSNMNTLVQLVKYHEDADEVVVSCKSAALKKYGWSHSASNIPAAYLTGMLCAKKAIAKGVSEAILDFGMNVNVKGSRIYAALKGASDGGLKIKFNDKMIPSEERIKGSHIESHVKRSSSITSDFDKTKKAIENDGRGKKQKAEGSEGN